MLKIIFAFLCGIVLFTHLKTLPDKRYMIALSLTLLIMPFFFKRYKNFTLIVSSVIVAILYCYITASQILAINLAPQEENVQITVTGQVSSLVNQGQFGQQFLFTIEKIGDRKLPGPLVSKLYWSTLQKIHIGDVWKLSVKLKKIHGNRSLGAFDYEAYAFQNKLRASGSVVHKLPQHYITSKPYQFPLQKLREILRDRYLALPDSKSFSPWILALILGIRNNLPAADWEILRSTGTNHLMAIAGLHIGMIVTFVYFCMQRLLNLCPRIYLIATRQDIAGFIAVCAGVTYAALSGLSVPAERAALTLALFFLTKSARRFVSPFHVTGAALFILVLINPHDVLSESIWLSFATIFMIFYGSSNRLNAQGGLKGWMKLQGIMSLGLLPFVLYFYQQCSLISFLANAITVPLLGFIILPLLILALIVLVIYAPIANTLFLFATLLINWLWLILKYFAQLPLAVFTYAMPSAVTAILSVIAVLIVLMPSGVRGRLFSGLFLLPLVFPTTFKPQLGEMRVTVLDVGQGLATVIETQNHVLVYDTGLKFNDTDMGLSIVLPYLRANHINHVELVMISHGDNDHIGGLQALINGIPIREISTSDVPKVKLIAKKAKLAVRKITKCHAGKSFEWDGVLFETLAPTSAMLLSKNRNNQSCVLKVTARNYSILLPGDIEERGEKILTKNVADALHADILVAPHHGSKTSGHLPFIEFVRPSAVIYSTGYLNRYHFPHPSITQLYQDKKLCNITQRI